MSKKRDVLYSVKVNCKYNNRFQKWQPESLSSFAFPDSFDNIKFSEENLE